MKSRPNRCSATLSVQARLLFSALLLAATPGLTSCYGKPSFCDIDKQMSFLEIGPSIVGTWVEQKTSDQGPAEEITFTEEGHLVYPGFGCGDSLFPLEPGGRNTSEAQMGYASIQMKRWNVERGFARLDYTTNASTDWIEIRFQGDDTLLITSTPDVPIEGVFKKRSKDQDSSNAQTTQTASNATSSP